MNRQYTTQIENMDYSSLVYMLLEKITPDVRKKILNRLVEMNEQLIYNMQINSNKTKYFETTRTNGNTVVHNALKHQVTDQIDMDDIINDIHQRDVMDIKLGKIQKLYEKIIMNKKERENAKLNSLYATKKI
jgi:hypothetical protein